MMTTTGTEGSKYVATKTMSTTEIAVAFRADVNAAIKAGELPKGLRLSVRTKYFSGGSSITVDITALPSGFRVLSDDYLRNPIRCAPWQSKTEEAKALIAKLEGLLNAYNFDNSDSMTDYFHVRFYGHVNFSRSIMNAEEARTVAA